MKKSVGVILAALLAVSGLAGCTGSKKLVMGTNAEFPPFEYVTDNGLVGNISGVDVAISLEIAKEMNRELQVENMEFESVLLAVPNGKVDFAAAGMTIKPERLEVMDFSIPYFVAKQVMIVRDDNTDINSAADIIEKTVGAVNGYTGYYICDEDLGIKNLEGYKKSTDVIMALTQSKVDVVVLDSKTADALLKLNSGLKIIEDSSVFEAEEYAIAVKKGNTQLLDTINKVLERLISEGKIDEFVMTYSD